MQTVMKSQPEPKKEKHMEWISWSSPLGSGLFILALSYSFYLFTQSVYTLTKTGKNGKEIGQMKDS
jgi:hypothetical protein